MAQHPSKRCYQNHLWDPMVILKNLPKLYSCHNFKTDQKKTKNGADIKIVKNTPYFTLISQKLAIVSYLVFPGDSRKSYDETVKL